MAARRILGPVYAIVADELGDVKAAQDFDNEDQGVGWGSRYVNNAQGYLVCYVYARVSTLRAESKPVEIVREADVKKLPKPK